VAFERSISSIPREEFHREVTLTILSPSIRISALAMGVVALAVNQRPARIAICLGFWAQARLFLSMNDWGTKNCCSERETNEPNEKGIHPVLQGAATITELEARKRQRFGAG